MREPTKVMKIFQKNVQVWSFSEGKEIQKSRLKKSLWNKYKVISTKFWNTFLLKKNQNPIFRKLKTRVILIPHQNDLLVPHIAHHSFSCFLHHNLTNWGWGSIVADFWMLGLVLYFANVLLAFIYAAVSELRILQKAMAFAIRGFYALSKGTTTLLLLLPPKVPEILL